MSKRALEGLKTRGRKTERRSAPPRPESSSITRELTRVAETNLAFYEAFAARDIASMEKLWSRSPYSRCVHPGWEPVIGWHEIRQSWVDIFRTMQSIHFELENVHIEVSDRSAWINLVAHAHVITEDADEFHTTIVATNIFEKVDDQWLIVLHHSSHCVDDEDLEDEAMALDDGSGGFEPN